MICLDNSKICVKIAYKGAEIKSIVVDGEERIWPGDDNFWDESAPVLFPICGALKDSKFVFEGKEYNLVKHGFGKNMDFVLENSTRNSATFLLKSNEETKKQYPWDFELRIKYELINRSIKVYYDVKNTSDKTMYTAIGAHEGYYCPDGYENYDIIFEKNETLESIQTEGELICNRTETVLKDGNTLPLYKRFFGDSKTLIFADHKSRYVTLKNRVTAKSVSVEFSDFDYLLIWTKTDAPYLCIEPWTTLPSHVDDNYELSDKQGMTAVEPDGHFKRTHTIYF